MCVSRATARDNAMVSCVRAKRPDPKKSSALSCPVLRTETQMPSRGSIKNWPKNNKSQQSISQRCACRHIPASVFPAPQTPVKYRNPRVKHFHSSETLLKTRRVLLHYCIHTPTRITAVSVLSLLLSSGSWPPFNGAPLLVTAQPSRTASTPRTLAGIDAGVRFWTKL